MCAMPKKAVRKAASPHRVAVVQHPPVTLHRQKTLERGVALLEEAASAGARLVSFPETWLPGYPEWIWRLRPSGGFELAGGIHGRLVWNASGLRVSETPRGRVGGLICWENYMPLARFAIFAQGCEIYVAPTWDEGSTWISTMRHIAAEGRCWVLGNGTAMRGKDIPKDFPKRAELFPDLEEWYNPGDSVIVSPGGRIVAGPLHEEHGILYAECDPVVASTAKRTLDVAGHYGRPDIFKLEVNREVLAPIDFG